jgi:hypothetical protein
MLSARVYHIGFTATQGSWRRVVLGMTLADVLAVGITANAIKKRVRKGVLAFDPPLFPIKLGGRRPAPQRDITQRKCMSCRRAFPSEHKGNRLCLRCKANHAATYDSPYAPW